MHIVIVRMGNNMYINLSFIFYLSFSYKVDCGEGTAMYVMHNKFAYNLVFTLCLHNSYHVFSFFSFLYNIYRSDITVRFIDENNKELGRDYFVSPGGQCTVSGYGNIKTITPRGGNNVYMVASCDLCGKMAGQNLVSTQMPINGQVTDCF